MFRTLTLKNFKKHEQLHVDFTAGLNGIFGPNYKGKSTILYGLLFALGGATHVPGNRIARRGSDGRFSVEAVFSIPHEMYKLDYRVVRTKSTANLYLGGSDEPIASGTTAVNDKIEELIGMSVKQWKELHFAKQKNAHSLLRYSAGNLHSLMRRLVGAEELDQIQQRVKRLVDKEEGVLAGLPVIENSAEECLAKVDEAFKQRNEAQARLEAVEGDIAGLQENEKNGLAVIQKASERLTKAQEEKGAATTLAARLDAATRGVAAAQGILLERGTDRGHAQIAVDQLLESHDAAAGEKIAQFERLRLRRAAAERNAEQAASRLEAAKLKVEELRPAAERSKKAYDEQAAELGDVSSKLADNTERERAAASRRAVAAQKVEDLKAAVEGAACPTCQRPFEDHDPEALAGELKAASDALVKINAELQGLQMAGRALIATQGLLEDLRRVMTADVDHLKRAELAAQDCEGDVGDAQEELQAVLGDEADLGLTEADVVRLREQSQALAMAQQKLAQANNEYAKAEQALAGAQSTLDAIKAKGEPADVKVLDEEIAKLGAQLTKDRATLAELRQVLADSRGRRDQELTKVSLAQREGDHWTRLQKQAEETGERAEKAQKRVARLRHLQKHLKDNAEGYMGKVWAAFLAQASRIASQCTGGDIQALDRTADGAFTYLEDGEEMQLEEASGAQEAIIGLAVQLALSTAAPCHLNVLLLDEPTADMDPNCSMATIAAMKALGQQVIFVSHQQTDNTLCDNAITL